MKVTKEDSVRFKDLITWEKGVEVGKKEYLDKGFDFARVRDFSINGFENISKKISEKRFLELREKCSTKKRRNFIYKRWYNWNFLFIKRKFKRNFK